MLKFLISIEFWATTALVVALCFVVGVDRLSSFVQVAGLFGTSYAIYRLHQHHAILRELKGGDNDATEKATREDD